MIKYYHHSRVPEVRTDRHLASRREAIGFLGLVLVLSIMGKVYIVYPVAIYHTCVVYVVDFPCDSIIFQDEQPD